MTAEAFFWAPYIALGCGVAAGVSVLHSARRAFAVAVALWFLQVFAWAAALTGAVAERRAQPANWNADLFAAFLLSLTAVTPYTVIGAVLSGALVGLARRLVRARKNHGDSF
jgi:hypothetical protein